MRSTIVLTLLLIAGITVIAVPMLSIQSGQVAVATDRTNEQINADLDDLQTRTSNLECNHHDFNCPTPTAVPTDTPIPTATATNTPEPTATNTPTNTPTAQTCQQLHDSFVVEGPDGNMYPTWHPMKVGNCTFGHEHGNDSRSVEPNFQPAFGYVNAVHGMIESHHGFKVYALTNHLTNIDWVVTQHQGTTTRNALCGRFHAVNIVAYRDGVLMANLSIMGDFGTSRLGDSGTKLTPPDCPTQNLIVSQGLRRIPTFGTSGGDGYTPYIINQTFAELGLRINVSFLTTNGRTGCPDVTCAKLFVNENNAGDRRRFQTLSPAGININVSATTTNTGWFEDSMGVMQYIAPGFASSLGICDSQRTGQFPHPSSGANGCWYADADGAGPLTKEQSPMRAAVDNNGFNGTSLGFPLASFVEN